MAISFDNTTAIDINMMKTIADAINKHDTMIGDLSTTFLSNNTTVPLSDSDTNSETFDFSTNLIQFGRSDVTNVNMTSPYITEIEVTFKTPFSSVPYVIATPRFSNPTRAWGLVLVSTTETGFKGRIVPAARNGDGLDTNSKINFSVSNTGVKLDWVAIGNRVL